MAENAQGVANDMKSNFEDPAYIAAEKEYMDSANYWGGLLVAYEEKNMQAYLQAATNKGHASRKNMNWLLKIMNRILIIGPKKPAIAHRP